MPAYEYCRATWPEVCDLGPQGWRLVAVPPVQEVRVLLGQQQVSEPMYVMERAAAPGRGAGQPAGPVASLFMPGKPS